MAYYQQGDVLIKEYDESAVGKWRHDRIEARKRRELDEFVVAEGEATGHSHKIKGKIVNYVPAHRTDQIVFELTEASTIYHEEHGEITLPPGKYYIEQVREYDHFAEESRVVRD